MLPYFPCILFLEKNNLNKTQITPILKIISKWILNLSFFESPNSYFIYFEEVILSSLVKIIELHKVSEMGNIFKWNSNIFNTPCHLNKWKKSCHLLSRVLWWKEFEFTEIIKAKMKVWESPFIPSHLTFKKFRISHNKSNNQSNLSIYLIKHSKI